MTSPEIRILQHNHPSTELFSEDLQVCTTVRPAEGLEVTRTIRTWYCRFYGYRSTMVVIDMAVDSIKTGDRR